AGTALAANLTNERRVKLFLAIQFFLPPFAMPLKKPVLIRITIIGLNVWWSTSISGVTIVDKDKLSFLAGHILCRQSVFRMRYAHHPLIEPGHDVLQSLHAMPGLSRSMQAVALARENDHHRRPV